MLGNARDAAEGIRKQVIRIIRIMSLFSYGFLTNTQRVNGGDIDLRHQTPLV